MSQAQYLVIGNPIAHSLSPQIHTEFAKQTQQSLVYDRLCVEPEHFFSVLDNFFQSGGLGANITAPFKSLAFDYTRKHCSEAARLSKAVNTLILKDNIVYGDNTDGIGLMRDLHRLQWTLTGKKLFILGAGGAVRGILPSLFAEKPESITLFNRTVDRTQTIIHEFPFCTMYHQNQLLQSNQSSYDIIFNAIPPMGLTDTDFLEVWTNIAKNISVNTCAYDLSYDPKHSCIFDKLPFENPQTPFISLMQQSTTCKNITDGFGLLLEQAAESFFLWRGVKPDLAFSHII